MASPSPRLPDRPISPHLSVYRFNWTMAMSIAHRLTGVACYAALPLLVIWLWAVADSPGNYTRFTNVAGSWLGIPALIGLSWALIHHAIGGVRHLVWDTGTGLTNPARYLWAKATLAGSVILTALLWLAIFLGGG